MDKINHAHMNTDVRIFLLINLTYQNLRFIYSTITTFYHKLIFRFTE